MKKEHFVVQRLCRVALRGGGNRVIPFMEALSFPEESPSVFARKAGKVKFETVGTFFARSTVQKGGGVMEKRGALKWRKADGTDFPLGREK